MNNRMYQILAAAFYTAAFFLIFPFYKYWIDTDGISYINVAKRLASGHWYEATNGYWSPMSSWILVPFIKMGFDPVLASKYITGLLGLLSLFAFQHLTGRLKIAPGLRIAVSFIAAIILLAFCFYSLHADLLSLFLLLVYGNLLCMPGIFQKTKGWLSLSAIGALMYYAKTYNGYFFLLHISLLIWFWKKNNAALSWKQVLKKWVAICTVFALLVAPFVAALSIKYKGFTLSTAGKLNSTWYLAPGLTDSQRVAVPPPYTDAVSYWDDPWYQQTKFVSAVSSKKYFNKQLKLTAGNSRELIKILWDISVVTIPVIVLLIFLYKKFPAPREPWVLTSLAATYPLGYLMVIIEWRYVWILHLILLMLTAILLNQLILRNPKLKWVWLIASILTLGSFLIKPLKELGNLDEKGRYEWGVADLLNKYNIRGKFLVDIHHSGHQSASTVICYYTGSKLFGIYKKDPVESEMVRTIKQYGITHILQFVERDENPSRLTNPLFIRLSKKVETNLVTGMIIYFLD